VIPEACAGRVIPEGRVWHGHPTVALVVALADGRREGGHDMSTTAGASPGLSLNGTMPVWSDAGAPPEPRARPALGRPDAARNGRKSW